jgi:DNA polymerase-3 subunit beta
MTDNPIKFHINRLEFLSALTSAAAVVPSRITLPILSTVKLEIGGEAVGLTVDNLDSRMTVTRAATIMTPGAFCLPARRLLDAASRIQGETLFFDAAGRNAIRVSDGNGSRLDFLFLPAEEFPQEPPEKAASGADFEKGELSTALKTVLPCASDDQTRWVLQGVCLEGDGKLLNFVATNGVRLRQHSLASPLQCSVIIPTAAARLMAAMSADSDCRLAIGENAASLQGANWHFRTKLIEGDYPNWRQAIPGDAGDAVDVNRAALVDALRLACVIEQVFPSVHLSARDGRLLLSVRDAQTGESEITVSDSTCGLKAALALSPEFLLDAIQSFPHERLTLKNTSPFDPLVIRDERGVAVIMPKRIS